MVFYESFFVIFLFLWHVIFAYFISTGSFCRSHLDTFFQSGVGPNSCMLCSIYLIISLSGQTLWIDCDLISHLYEKFTQVNFCIYWTGWNKSLIFVGHAYPYYNGTYMQSTRPKFTSFHYGCNYPSHWSPLPLSTSGGFKSLIPANRSAYVLIQLLSSHAVSVYKNCCTHFAECILRSHVNIMLCMNNTIAGFLMCNLCACASLWFFKNAV